MYLVCDKCGGRVLSDRVLFTENHLELFCFSCGKRWIYNHPENRGAFAVWLWQMEKAYLKKSSVA
jgi:uncharacterized Zn finger protein